MAECTIICEGQTDADILQALLPESAARGARFLIGHGKSSGVSKARTLLLRPASSVLLIEDADTLNDDLIQERRDFIHGALSLVSSPERFDAFIFVPEIEVVFFQDTDFLALFGKSLNETKLRAARYAPKLALRELGLTVDIIRQAGPQGLHLLQQSPLIRGLLAKVGNLMALHVTDVVSGV